MKPRNIFIVANNIEEIGGVQRIVHVYASMFSEAGHNVELIGVRHADQPHTYVTDPPYRMTVAYEGEFQPTPRPEELARRGKEGRAARAAMAKREAALERLNERFASVDDGILIVTQVWAMQWVAHTRHDHLHLIVQSHEVYEASQGRTPGSAGVMRHKRIMKLYPDADLFLLLTQADADKFERDGLNNVGVMQNPLPFFPEEPAPLTAKTVINVGRYAREKDQARLIEAFALVHTRHPDWTLRLVGDGPTEPVLREKVRELHLEDVVDVAGPTNAVVDALKGASIFALSSDNEGLPVVLAEAMACGVPCVSFDCSPGVRELITDGEDGLIVPHQDVAALAEGICRLIEDEPLRRTLAGRARDSVRRLSPDRVLEQWHELFEYVER
jgi:glycosyltransferase involved in cell wall biosynthesis